MAGISVSFVNTTTFTVATDLTATFNTGRRCRFTATSGYLYGNISSSSYSSPNTTVILTAASDNLDSSISIVYYGIKADSLGSLPIHSHDEEKEGGSLTLANLSDTPAVYENGKFLQATSSGTKWTSDIDVTNHSELNELDYASAGHTGFAPTSHSHTESDISDLDKYTESEVDTISGSLNTKIDGKADTSHIHDDRYYTESEVDTISGSLSSEIDSDITTHTSNSDAHHNESHTIVSHSDTTATGANLNELVGSGDTILHKHDTLYYTESEIDTISGSLQTDIDNKSEVTTLLDLSDTPTTYSGSNGYYVKTTNSGIEFETNTHWRSYEPFLDENYANDKGVPTVVNRGLFKGYSMPIWSTPSNANEELLFRIRVPFRWDGVTNPWFCAITSLSATEDVGDKYKFQLDWVSKDVGYVLPDTITETLTNEITVVDGTAYFAEIAVFELDAATLVPGQNWQGRVRRIAASSSEISNEPIVWHWCTRWKMNKLGTETTQGY